MARKIRVPEKFLPAIAQIGEHASRLPLLAEVSANATTSKHTPESIASLFAARAQVPREIALEIVVQVMAFQDLRSTSGMSAAELFDAVTASLEQQVGPLFEAQSLEKWRGARPQIEKAMEPGHPLGTLQKTNRLTYAHQNVFYDVRIISDLRPVFDDSGRDVQLMTISHVLQIEYHDGSGDRHMFFAIDADDLAKLRKACERAETKAITLRDALQKLPWPVVVAGDYLDE